MTFECSPPNHTYLSHLICQTSSWWASPPAFHNIVCAALALARALALALAIVIAWQWINQKFGSNDKRQRSRRALVLMAMLAGAEVAEALGEAGARGSRQRGRGERGGRGSRDGDGDGDGGPTDHEEFRAAESVLGQFERSYGAEPTTYNREHKADSTTTDTSSFETGFDEWSTTSFERSMGAPLNSTGPTSAAGGSYFMQAANELGGEVSLQRDYGGSVDSISFYYHMHGADAGSVMLAGSSDGGTTFTTLWSKSGDQGGAWVVASVQLKVGSRAFPEMLKFVVHRPGGRGGEAGDWGWFAVDEVAVRRVVELEGQQAQRRRLTGEFKSWDGMSVLTHMEFRGLMLSYTCMAGYVMTNSNIGTAVDAWCDDEASATSTYGNITTWDTSDVTNMYQLFYYETGCNPDISSWVSLTLTSYPAYPCVTLTLTRPETRDLRT